MLKAVASQSLAAAGITIGTSVITGGTNTRVLFDDSGVVGEDAGLTYNKSTSALALGSAGLLFWSTDVNLNRQSAGVIRVGTTAANTSGFLWAAGLVAVGAVDVNYYGGGICIDPNTQFGWAATNIATGTKDVILTRGGAATLQFGAANAAAPVAQTMRVQSVVAGTADTAGTDWTHIGSLSTGAGAGGKMVFKTSAKGAASTTQNTSLTALTISAGTTNNTNVGMPSVIQGNGAAIATTATDGFMYIANCAGTPTGVPTAFTGSTPMVYDTSANKIWAYNGSWRGVAVA